jgi:hypothetical protein
MNYLRRNNSVWYPRTITVSVSASKSQLHCFDMEARMCDILELLRLVWVHHSCTALIWKHVCDILELLRLVWVWAHHTCSALIWKQVYLNNENKMYHDLSTAGIVRVHISARSSVAFPWRKYNTFKPFTQSILLP